MQYQDVTPSAVFSHTGNVTTFQTLKNKQNKLEKVTDMIDFSELPSLSLESPSVVTAIQFNCNHIELFINNAPLTYVYPNTIETCLTLSHLLFGKQLLYSCNTTSTVVRNLIALSSTTDKINCISNHFLDRWRYEYVVNVHETQRT